MITTQIEVTSAYRVNRDTIRQVVAKFLQQHNILDATVEVSIVGRRKIKQLNEYLGHTGVTDVLSFPLHEKKMLNDIPVPPNHTPHLGSIVVCYPVAVAQATQAKKSIDNQLKFLLEHSLLHLLGYHHE